MAQPAVTPPQLSRTLLENRRAVAHALRRLSMGVHPELIAECPDVDAAIARAFDLSAPAPVPFDYPAPATFGADPVSAILGPITWWIDAMVSSPRLIEERLVWFWHDHFATGLQKVRYPYLMWQQHQTIRRHATGSFAELLHAIAKDPAMLVYLDGVANTVRDRNENFGREVMELFTVGRGHYSEADVVEMSRAASGWTVNIPRRLPSGAVARATGPDAAPWQSSFVAARADRGTKTILGTTAAFDLDGALDRLLEEPATATRIASKLFRELVGRSPSQATADRLGRRFRRDWQVLGLVEDIVATDAFTSDAAFNARVRTPVEKLVGMLQAVPTAAIRAGSARPQARPGAVAGLADALRALGYVPFAPPNVAGFPKGTGLVGPSQLVHTFDLLSVYATQPEIPRRADALVTRFGLFGVSDRTRSAVEAARDPRVRLALVLGSPEYALA